MSEKPQDAGEMLAAEYARDLALWDEQFYGCKPYGHPTPESEMRNAEHKRFLAHITRSAQGRW